MDQNLFVKYNQAIKKRETTQKDIIILIEELTGVFLTKNEINLQNKTISFNISSVKKLILRNKKIEQNLKEKGYNIKF